MPTTMVANMTQWLLEADSQLQQGMQQRQQLPVVERGRVEVSVLCVPIREVSPFQRVVWTGFNGVGVPIREVSLFLRVVCTGFNGVGT